MEPRLLRQASAMRKQGAPVLPSPAPTDPKVLLGERASSHAHAEKRASPWKESQQCLSCQVEPPEDESHVPWTWFSPEQRTSLPLPGGSTPERGGALGLGEKRSHEVRWAFWAAPEIPG